MKKILLLFIGIFLFAKSDIYLDYVNKLVNYGFELKNLKTDKAPFEIKIDKNIKHKNSVERTLVKKIKIELLSIFNNQVYLKIDEYLGDQLIKTQKKWLKKSDRIYNCKIIKISLEKVILKCGKKILIKSLNKKIPGFKETR